MPQVEQLNNVTVCNKIPGSYKLGVNIVTRLVSRLLKKGDRVALNTSANAIDLMLYFSTVCDNNNMVYDFSYTEVEDFSDMSTRSFYYCLQTLKNFDFIEYESTGHGTINIKILNNDDKDLRKYGYINTNRSFFIKGTDSFFVYQQLSLYAKKTLLLLIALYRYEYGLQIQIKTIAEYLGIKNTSLVFAYLEELKALLEEDFYRIDYRSNPKIIIAPRLYVLMPYGDYKDQETYLKRTIKKAIIARQIVFVDLINRTVNNSKFKKQIIYEISSVFIKYVSLGIDFIKLLERFLECLNNRDRIDRGFVYSLQVEFKALYAKKQNEIFLA